MAVVPMKYPSDGCPVDEGSKKCGETRGLDIIMDFHKVYKDKMNQIDSSPGDENLQEKVNLQQEWINDLTEQNKLLAKVIAELEKEAINQVQSREDKLKNVIKSFGENERATTSSTDYEKSKNPTGPSKSSPLTSMSSEKNAEDNGLSKESKREKTATSSTTMHETITILKKKVRHLEEMNAETRSEVSIKNDIIRELRKEVKRNKPKESIMETEHEKIIRKEAFKQFSTPRKYNIENSKIADDNSKVDFKYEEFVRSLPKVLSSTPNHKDVKMPCKSNCLLWKLFYEISELNLQVRIRDELLIQQFNIIRVLATKLFIMETCFQKMNYIPDEKSKIPSGQEDDKSQPLIEEESENKPLDEIKVISSRTDNRRVKRMISTTGEEENLATKTKGSKTEVQKLKVKLLPYNMHPERSKSDNNFTEEQEDSDDITDTEGTIKRECEKNCKKCPFLNEPSKEDLMNEIKQLQEEIRRLKSNEDEVQRLKEIIDDNMKTILKLNSENRKLNEMINKLKDEMTSNDPASYSSAADNKQMEDVFQQGKDKFITDSSSTVEREDSYHEYPNGKTSRARAGNDTNIRDDDSKIRKDVECGTSICKQNHITCSFKSCQTAGCEYFKKFYSEKSTDEISLNLECLDGQPSNDVKIVECKDKLCPFKDKFPSDSQISSSPREKEKRPATSPVLPDRERSEQKSSKPKSLSPKVIRTICGCEMPADEEMESAETRDKRSSSSSYNSHHRDIVQRETAPSTKKRSSSDRSTDFSSRDRSDPSVGKREHPSGAGSSENVQPETTPSPKRMYSSDRSASSVGKREHPSGAESSEDTQSETTPSTKKRYSANRSRLSVDKREHSSGARSSEDTQPKTILSTKRRHSTEKGTNDPCNPVCECEPSTFQKKGDIEERKPSEKSVANSGLSTPRKSDKSIIRCICKSKYCKVVPDPTDPSLSVCTDVSEYPDVSNPDDPDAEEDCCCRPACPKGDYRKDQNRRNEKSDDSVRNRRNPTDADPSDAIEVVADSVDVMETYDNDEIRSRKSSTNCLSKEQEYAGLSRKEKFSFSNQTKRISSQYDIQIPDEPDESLQNADLKLTIANLKSKLLDAEDKIEDLKKINNFDGRDNDTIIIARYSEEINDLKTSLRNAKKEHEDYEILKQKVKLLEQGKGDTESVTANLRTAVDLYVNTIKVLEDSEQKLKLENDQCRMANETLRESLFCLKQEMEEMKNQFQKNLEEQDWHNFTLVLDIDETMYRNSIFEQKIHKYQKLNQLLMEFNYELEVEHVNTLQDLSTLEVQFLKNKYSLNSEKEDKLVITSQLKKLSKKNKCYEEVVKFFKDEMSVMSEELLTLQEVMNVTNLNSQEENNKLINAVLQLRRINDRLISHLCAMEQQVVLDTQINQMNETKINELHHIIETKNKDLCHHDEIIQEMKMKLSSAIMQNAELKQTIQTLTDTVVEIQEGIKSVEKHQLKNKTEVTYVESKICLANGNLEDIKACMEQKNRRITELESELKNNQVSLILANKECEISKQLKVEAKEKITSLKEQLYVSEKNYNKLLEKYQMMVKELKNHSSLDHMKNYELSHYKHLVEEMRSSLMQMNNGLEKCEATNIHYLDDIKSTDQLSIPLRHEKSNMSVLFDELKRSISDMKRRLSEADYRGGLIQEELLKVKETHIPQIPEETAETMELRKTISSIEEISRMNRLIEEQKEEIERMREELQRERETGCVLKRSVSELKNEKMTSNAQMEISQLKIELNKSLQRQKLVDEEKEKIQAQMANFGRRYSTLENDNEELKQENEDLKTKLKKITREKEYIAYKNQELKETIEKMQNTHDFLEKQCRYSNDCLRNVELELSEAQIEKENISSEAQNLLRVVKLWLQEQDNINGQIRGKFQNYSDTITTLKQSIMKQMANEHSWIKSSMPQTFSPRHCINSFHAEHRALSPNKQKRSKKQMTNRPKSPLRIHNDLYEEDYPEEDANSYRSNYRRNFSYDSSFSPCSSKSPSPKANSLQGEEQVDQIHLNDWFSSNYRETDTDVDEVDDGFIHKIQMMTAQVQEANRKWENKMNKSRANH